MTLLHLHLRLPFSNKINDLVRWTNTYWTNIYLCAASVWIFFWMIYNQRHICAAGLQVSLAVYVLLRCSSTKLCNMYIRLNFIRLVFATAYIFAWMCFATYTIYNVYTTCVWYSSEFCDNRLQRSHHQVKLVLQLLLLWLHLKLMNLLAWMIIELVQTIINEDGRRRRITRADLLMWFRQKWGCE